MQNEHNPQTEAEVRARLWQTNQRLHRKCDDEKRRGDTLQSRLQIAEVNCGELRQERRDLLDIAKRLRLSLWLDGVGRAIIDEESCKIITAIEEQIESE
jgi:hypothetical protein